MLVGGGIKGGQVIGKTDRDGADGGRTADRRQDFMATVCKVLGIDYTKQIQHAERPADPHRRQGRQPDQGIMTWQNGSGEWSGTT